MKLTYDSIPEAITQALNKVKQIEKLLEDGIADQVDNQKSHRQHREKLTLQQASQVLGISKTSLYTNVRNNTISFSRKGGRLFFSNHALKKWIKRRKEKERKKASKILPVMDPDGITVREAVKVLGLPPSRIAYLIKSRELPVIAKDGNRLFYSKTQLLEILDRINESKISS